jgi:hypothetical protein
MSARIYRKAAAKAEFSNQYSSVDSGEVPHLLGNKVYAPESKEPFLYIQDPMDPSATLPNIPRRLVKRVTYQGSYLEGFRPNGLYKYKRATARLETKVRGHRDNPFREQEIHISGGSIRTLREMYSKIRAGDADVVCLEDWSMNTRPVAKNIVSACL